MRIGCTFVLVSWLTAVNASADMVDLDAIHTGGYFGDGVTNVDPAFQNYFVGHATVAGDRTAERRNFFVFDLSGVSSPVTAAELTLSLPFGGFIGNEPLETFVLTATPFAPEEVSDPVGLGVAATDIFDTLGMGPLYGEVMLAKADEGTPGDPAEIVFTLSPTALADINASLGGAFVMGGRFVSHDDLPGELDEILFGFTDIVTPSGPPLVPFPSLTLTTVAVPEVNANVAILLACAFVAVVWSIRKRSHCLRTPTAGRLKC